MSKTYFVTTAYGQCVEGEDGKHFVSFNLAQAAADRCRVAAVKAGHPEWHYHVVMQETVYVTSTLEDILKV